MNFYKEIINKDAENFMRVSKCFTSVYDCFTSNATYRIEQYFGNISVEYSNPDLQKENVLYIKSQNPDAFNKYVASENIIEVITALSEDAFLNRSVGCEYSFDVENYHPLEDLDEFNAFMEKKAAEGDVRAERLRTSILQRTLLCMAAYMEKVLDMNNQLMVMGRGKEFEAMDKSRSVTHNSLISNLKLINEWCVKYGMREIYKLNDDDKVNRQIAANYAFYTCKAMFLK